MIAGFTEEQIKRYSRQIVLPEVGGRGQRKLLNAKILCIGAGGLGSAAIAYLAAAGIGKLGIIDSDEVEISNLQRQIIHCGNIGKSKAISAKEFVERLNSDVRVIAYEERFNAWNARRIIKEYDFIVDGSDNFPTKYLVNDACVLENKPFSHASILRYEGYVTTFIPHITPCYRCIFEAAPPPDFVPSCQEAGVLGAVPGILGAIQAAEAMKFILGIGELLTGRILCIDALKLSFEEVKIRRRRACPACGAESRIAEIKAENYIETCAVHW